MTTKEDSTDQPWRFFFEPVRFNTSRRSVSAQVKSGLRLGIGFGMWLIAIISGGKGLVRLIGLGHYHSIRWQDWVGWLELALACALLLISAHISYLLVGGYALSGFFKSIFILIAGRSIYAPYTPVSRLTAAELAGITLLVAVLLFQFVGKRMSILDRIALTLFTFCFLNLESPLVLGLGVAGLALAWAVDRSMRHTRRRKHYRTAVS